MSDVAIKIENLSKQYRLGVVGTGTLSHDLKRWWTVNMRGKEDPYLKIGETNDRSTKANSEYVWALKDINLEIKQGDVVGIIGKNGAGKSTLLKILSKVTKPTTGSVQYKGRIASLLEVGTGFHMEMTGRENIYMNGSIMGMTRTEITRKLNEIIDFAGVERFIDTPVKRYSSGMTVRLGFAIAAHLEPEILIVDEVLAVGDAEFQKKAIGKMQDVSKGEGRTVLFVSHNLTAVKSLCTTGFVLDQGRLVYTSSSKDACNFYLSNNSLLSTNALNSEAIGNDNIIVQQIQTKSLHSNRLSIDNPFSIIVSFTSLLANKSIGCSLFVSNEDNIIMFESFCSVSERDSKVGKYKVIFNFPSHILNSGTYTITLLFAENQQEILLNTGQFFSFELDNAVYNNRHIVNKTVGVIKPLFKTEIQFYD